MTCYDPSQTQSTTSTTKPEPDETPQAENPAGIISHRNQFSTPDSILESGDDPLSGGSMSSPFQGIGSSPTAKRTPMQTTSPGGERYGTLFLGHVEKITSGLQGGVEIVGIDVFKKPLRILVREIQLTPVDMVRVTDLSEVSLTMFARDLFDVNLNDFKIDSVRYDTVAWYRFLNESILPIIDELTDFWLGSPNKDVPNPVTELFYGPNGILNGSLHPELVLERVRNLQGERIVPIQRKYVGKATVITYEREYFRLL